MTFRSKPGDKVLVTTEDNDQQLHFTAMGHTISSDRLGIEIMLIIAGDLHLNEITRIDTFPSTFDEHLTIDLGCITRTTSHDTRILDCIDQHCSTPPYPTCQTVTADLACTSMKRVSRSCRTSSGTAPGNVLAAAPSTGE